MPNRIQIRRTKGWRMPPDAVNVARPGVWGNPFPVDGSWMAWTAIAIGLRADKAGRRQAAVALHQSWMTGAPLRLREYDPIRGVEVYTGASLEFSDDSTISMGDHMAGLAVWAASQYQPPTLPERPDLSPLRGKDLACWCPLDGQPCHADTLIELANA